MQVLVDGNRSSADAWLQAHLAPLTSLPELSSEETAFVESLKLSAEERRRSKYAVDLTRPQLEERALLVGRLVNDWFRNNRCAYNVTAVEWRTLEGKFHLRVEVEGRERQLNIREELIDELLENGSEDAERRLSRLLLANVPEAQTFRPTA